MRDVIGCRSCFLVEWYQTGPVLMSAAAAADHLAGAIVDVHPPVALLMAVTVPDDQTVFAVFSAVDADAVIRICRSAGWPPDRVSADVRPWTP